MIGTGIVWPSRWAQLWEDKIGKGLSEFCLPLHLRCVGAMVPAPAHLGQLVQVPPEQGGGAGGLCSEEPGGQGGHSTAGATEQGMQPRAASWWDKREELWLSGTQRSSTAPTAELQALTPLGTWASLHVAGPSTQGPWET